MDHFLFTRNIPVRKWTEAIGRPNHDCHTGYTGIPKQNVDFANSLTTFWPQQYNDTYKAWQSFPRNLRHLLDFAATVNGTELDRSFEKLGLHDIAEIMDHLLSKKEGLKHVFQITPDFEDTFVNLGLGALLTDVKGDFSESHAQWKSQNTNLTSIFDALKKHAYRPMSERDAVNSIDVFLSAVLS